MLLQLRQSVSIMLHEAAKQNYQTFRHVVATSPSFFFSPKHCCEITMDFSQLTYFGSQPGCDLCTS